MVTRTVLTICLLLLIVTTVPARDFWDFPDVNTLPDDAELLLHDPALPSNDPDRRSRNIKGSALKALFPNRSTASQIAYSTGTVQDALDSLLYTPITITLYTLKGSSSNVTQEIGSSYDIGTGLYWETSRTPTVQTINSVAQTPPYVPAGSPYTTNQSWQLYVSDGTISATATRSVTFTHKRYWGVSSLPDMTDGELLTFSSEFSTSRSQSRTFTPSGQYIYVAYLATSGAATFTVNGFLDSSWVLVQREFVNASGYPAEFRIYRSANLLTGTYSVVVS